jgi:hypothetical protein
MRGDVFWSISMLGLSLIRHMAPLADYVDELQTQAI